MIILWSFKTKNNVIRIVLCIFVLL